MHTKRIKEVITLYTSKFLNFYQDTVLQSLINEVEQQYANVDDINASLQNSLGWQ